MDKHQKNWINDTHFDKLEKKFLIIDRYYYSFMDNINIKD